MNNEAARQFERTAAFPVAARSATMPRKNRRCVARLLAWLVLVAAIPAAAGQDGNGDLAARFARPPASARPWVYWMWIDGNVTREGITADLEAIERAGIGGVMLFDAKTGVPPGPVAFASPAWRALFRHAVAEAARLGLEVDMNNDASWTGSGGPWVTPELAMQRIVWTETATDGPKRLQTALGQPETVAGCYRDIAVLAVPTPPADADPKTRFRIDHLKEKTLDGPDRQVIASPTRYPVLPPDAVIAGERIIDLSSRLGKGGQLAWDVPAGKWTILRIGYTPTGAQRAFAGGGRRAGMRQAVQAGRGRPLRRSDGEAGGGRRSGRRQNAGQHAHR